MQPAAYFCDAAFCVVRQTCEGEFIMTNVRTAVGKHLLLAILSLALGGTHDEILAETVFFDDFEREGMLDASVPTIGTEVWSDLGDNAVTNGTLAVIATPGDNARANYPVQIADGEVHTYSIEIDVEDGQGDNWAAMGFAWNIDSDATATGTGPWMRIRSGDSDADIETFTLAGANRTSHNFGEGALAGLEFTNAGSLSMTIDARGATDTVQFFFNDRPLSDPMGLVPNAVANTNGIFISGLASASYDNGRLESVPEPSAVSLAMLSVLAWGIVVTRRRGRTD